MMRKHLYSLCVLCGVLAEMLLVLHFQVLAAPSRAVHTQVADFEAGDMDGGFQVQSASDGELVLVPAIAGLTSWTELNSSPLPQKRSLHTAVAIGRHVFVIGGNNEAGVPQDTVYHSTQQANGELVAWQTEPPLPQPLTGHVAVSAGQTVLVIGGQTGMLSQLITTTVYQASLTETGGLTSWQTLEATPLPQPLVGHAAAVVNGSLFVIGGTNASGRQETVYRAGLRADGTLTGWFETTPLPLPLVQHKAAAVGDCLFVTGGQSDSGPTTSSVYAAWVQPNGAIAPWQELVQAQLPLPLQEHVLLTASGRLIVAGGGSPTSTPLTHDLVYWAAVQPGCTLTPWQELSGAVLPRNLGESAGVALAGYLYLVGGQANSGLQLDEVYRANLIPAGVLGSWRTLSVTPLPDAISGPAAVVANGRLYVIGGEGQTTPLTQTYSASLQPGGELDGWRIETPLPRPLAHHALLNLGNRLLLLGGHGGNADSSAVYQAGLGPGGMLGAWNTHPCPLLASISYHAAVAAADHIFVSGGRTGFAETAAVHRLRRGDDGSQGCWQPINPLPLPLAGHASAAAGNYLFVSGGITQAGGETRDSLYRATINPDGSLTLWTELSAAPLPSFLWGHRMLAQQGYLYVLGGYDFDQETAQHRVYRAAIQANGDLGAWQELPGNALPQAIYDHAIAYDDLYLFVVGGLHSGQPQTDIYSASLYQGAPYAAYTNQFDLGSVQDMGVLDWRARGDPGAVLSVRFRLAGDDAEYGPWSEAFTQPPIPVYDRARYLQYQLLVENPNGGVKAVDEVSLTYGDVGDYVKVMDDQGVGISNAEVYLNGQHVGATGARGVLPPEALPDGLQPGDQLAALSPVAQAGTVREAHVTPDSRGVNWAHRTYLTNLVITDTGHVLPYTVARRGGQVINLGSDSPLVLYNLLVSIEWDADEAYTQQISDAVHLASDYLYDISDGQMAFGYVNIYDDAQHWADADIQISAKNSVWPHAYIGGITSNDKSHVIRVGRFWDGNSGNQGGWDDPRGFRTLAHEFGHYALYLYDEYFAYVFDENGDLVREVPAYCTGPENRNPTTDATNASVMDYQYTTSELSARGVPGLWSPLCEQTAQWQLNGESAWETLTRKYADFLSPPRWRLTTPAEWGGPMAGPAGLPSALPDWPLAEIHQGGASAPPQGLTVYGPQGPYWGALVTLYTSQGGYPVAIDQGFTNRLGEIDIYGAQSGDTLRAASFDGALSGAISVTEATTYTLVMVPSAGLQALAVPGLNPHLTLRPSSAGDSLYLRLYGLAPGGTLAAIVTQSGGSASQTTALSYSSSEEAYVGSATFSAPDAQPGTGTIQVLGAGGNNQGISFNSTYALQGVPRGRVNDLYSADGNLHVHLITNTLPVNAYAVLSSLNAAPVQPPGGLQIVGNVYDVKPSGTQEEADQLFVLKLHYDPEILKGDFISPETLRIYRWEPDPDPDDPTDQARWIAMAGSRLEEDNSVSIATRRFGIYALMGSRVAHSSYLPLIMKSD